MATRGSALASFWVLSERLGMNQRIWWLLVLWLGSALHAADSSGVRVVPNVTFLAPDRAEKLDLYLPAAPAAGKLSPAVVWIHGGGWTGGTKDEARAKEICTTLANAGYVAVSVDYQLGDGAWPTNLFDCKNAVRFLRARAAEYHLDPQRIAVAGGSAGGHLALMVGFTAGKTEFEPSGVATPYPGVSSAVRCVIDMYGPANLLTRRLTDPKGVPGEPRPQPETALRVFAANSDKADILRVVSPVTHVTKNSPPVLILHGKADTTVDHLQSEELARVLKERGVPHELVLVDDVGHTFAWEMWGKKKMSRDLRPVALQFLAKHMK
jgi:acetyl esterase/lipase